MAKICDHTCVGVLVSNPDTGALLLIERATPPIGIAPVAGHLDNHGTPFQAAVDELREEIGLVVAESQLRYLGAAQRGNVCRRAGDPSRGHLWHLFRYDTKLDEIDLVLSEREVRNARWHSRYEVQALAEVTADYARAWKNRDGRPDPAEDAWWRDFPGIEPVWVEFLSEMNMIQVSKKDRAACALLCAFPPEQSG